MSIVFDSKELPVQTSILYLANCFAVVRKIMIMEIYFFLKPGCLLWSKSIPFALTRTGLIEAIRIITISITRSTFVCPFARELSLQKKRCCVF